MSETSVIEISDIFSRENYKAKRKDLREKMVSRKKNRRIDVGPYMTMYFENRDTIIHQINEMVFIENGGEEQVREEILAYKSLVPNGKELIATVMIEIDSPIKRAEFLGKMGGFEETIDISIGEKNIRGKAELDVDRTTEDGKASSVQFVHFEFNSEDIEYFKKNKELTTISVDHGNYRHSTTLNISTVNELLNDFK